MILFVFLGIILAGILIFIIYKFFESIVALSSPKVECPVCGRKINIVGTTPQCYKCKSRLIKHADGHYIAKS